MNIQEAHHKRSLPNKLLLFLLAAYLLLGLALLDNYGEAWDNAWFYQYGQQSLDIYQQPFASYSPEDYGPVDTYNFGPVIVTTANLVARICAAVGITTAPLAIHRYVYFLFYLIGAAALYPLAKRLMSDWAALFATLLLFTQPLFSGQALTNPKDTPFMGLFIAAVYLGLRMVSAASPPAPARQPLSKRQRQMLLAWLAALLLWFIFDEAIIALLHTALTRAYQADPASFAGRLFALVGSASAPLSGYLAKVTTWANRLAYSALVLVFVLIAAPRFFHRLWAAFGAPGVLAAGVVLGLSISVRILGIGAGALVLAADLLAQGRRWQPTRALAYLAVTAISIYITWPYLWPAPIQRMLESLQVNFGHANAGLMWFEGQRYPSDQLPWQYVPKLLAIQLTEPLVIVGVLGAGLLLWRWLRHKQTDDLIMLGWLFAPLLLLVLLRPQLHDNLRHIFFIIPPLCLYAGVLFDAGYAWLGKRTSQAGWIGALAAVGLLLPGLIYSARYHPYEYIYYNQFIGGVDEALYRYELDYLGLSTSEAFDYLNQQAEPGATVFVLMQFDLAQMLARPDLILIDRFNHPDLPVTAANTYLITTTGTPDADTVFQAQIGSVPLATVKRMQPEE